MAPVLPCPGVATLRCCHLAILCSFSVGLVCVPLTERDHWPEEEVEKGWGGEPRGLLCCFRSMYHVTNSGVTRGAGIWGVVTLKCIILTHFNVTNGIFAHSVGFVNMKLCIFPQNAHGFIT